MHIHRQIMHYRIGNMCSAVVHNVHGFIFQVYNQISTIQNLALPYVCMCINTLHVVLYMSDALSIKRNSFNCVRLIHIQL